MSTIVRLREIARAGAHEWRVEVWASGVLTQQTTFPARPEARSIARKVADEHRAVVVLAGPDVIALPARPAPAARAKRASTKVAGGAA